MSVKLRFNPVSGQRVVHSNPWISSLRPQPESCISPLTGLGDRGGDFSDIPHLGGHRLDLARMSGYVVEFSEHHLRRVPSSDVDNINALAHWDPSFTEQALSVTRPVHPPEEDRCDRTNWRAALPLRTLRRVSGCCWAV